MEENNVDYKNMLVSELKEKASNDPRACKELGDRYLNSNQVQKAIELYNSGIEMAKENYEGTDEENDFLYNCYLVLSGCCEDGSDERVLNLLNAAEIANDEYKKADAYDEVATIYQYRGDRSNFEKYLLKGNYTTTYGCMRISTYFRRTGNLVDSEEWLEKANGKTGLNNPDFVAQEVIDYMLANRKNELDVRQNCFKLFNTRCFNNSTYPLYNYFLVDDEMQKIVNNISDLCKEKLNESDFSTNDILSLCFVCKNLKACFDARVADEDENYQSNFDFSAIDEFWRKCIVSNINNENFISKCFKNDCNVLIDQLKNEEDEETLREIQKIATAENNEKLSESVKSAQAYVWMMKNQDKVLFVDAKADPKTGDISFTKEGLQNAINSLSKGEAEERFNSQQSKLKKIALYAVAIWVLLFIGSLLERIFGVFGDVIFFTAIVYLVYRIVQERKKNKENKNQ